MGLGEEGWRGTSSPTPPHVSQQDSLSETLKALGVELEPQFW